MELGAALILSGLAFFAGTTVAELAGDTDTSSLGFDLAAALLFGVGLVVCMLSIGIAPFPGGGTDNGSVSTPSTPLAPAGIPPANINLSVRASHEYIGNQVATVGGLDAQLIGLTAVLATAGAVFAIVQHALNADRGILLAGLCIAALICLVGLVASPEPDPGPVPAEFFLDRAADSPEAYAWRMLTELAEAIADNDRAVIRRQGMLNAALLVLVLTPLIWGLVRALS